MAEQLNRCNQLDLNLLTELQGIDSGAQPNQVQHIERSASVEINDTGAYRQRSRGR